MPIIEIKILEGRAPETIEALIRNVSSTVSESLDSPLQNVRVLVDEVPKSHWGIAGSSVEKMKIND